MAGGFCCRFGRDILRRGGTGGVCSATTRHTSCVQVKFIPHSGPHSSTHSSTDNGTHSSACAPLEVLRVVGGSTLTIEFDVPVMGDNFIRCNSPPYLNADVSWIIREGDHVQVRAWCAVSGVQCVVCRVLSAV